MLLEEIFCDTRIWKAFAICVGCCFLCMFALAGYYRHKARKKIQKFKNHYHHDGKGA